MRRAASMIFAFVTTASGAAYADSRAATLFDSGLAEMRAGRYETACPALAESYRLDPLPGALFTLAECEAKWGKVASAVGHYADFIDVVSNLDAKEKKKQRKRANVARSELNRLRPQVPRLSIALSRSAPDVSVRLDDNELSPKSFGVPQPVDPGEHTVVWKVAGKSKSETVKLAAGEQRTLTLDVPAPEAPRATAPPPSRPPPTRRPPVPRPDDEESGSPTFAYVMLGIGAVGLAAGLVTGGFAWREKRTIDDNCNGDECNHDGKLAADRAKRFATISTIAFAVGGAGISVGVIALAFGSSSPKNPEGAAFSVKGRW